MAQHTKIEWADSTVNPVMGCTGCTLRKDHCYAATLCERYAGRPGWPKSFDSPEFFPGRLERAITWKDLTGTDRPDKPWLDGRPRHIFVNDLSDGFCPDVDPWQWLAPSLPAMHLSPHIWMLLTKWPDRMWQFFEQWHGPIPSNFWLGTTVTCQNDAWRIVHLLMIREAFRFVSIEPLLGLVDLTRIDYHKGSDHTVDALCEWYHHKDTGRLEEQAPPDDAHHLHLVICGGESGPSARPMSLDWARSLRDQCQEAGVSFFMKQMGTAWTRSTALGGPDQSPYLLGDTAGRNMEWWPEDLRVREMPCVTGAEE